MRRFITLCMLFLVQTGFGQDQGNLKTSSVFIFSDGHSFFVKEGLVPTKFGTYTIKNEAIPKARFGTLWFSSSATLAGIKSFTDTLVSIAPKPAKDIYELLKLNQDKKVSLVLEDRQIDGVIKGVEFNGDQPSVLYLLTSEGKWLTISPEKVLLVNYEEKPDMNKQDTLKRPQHTIDLTFKEKDQQVPLQMMYLQKGLAWSPFYYVEIQNSQKAKVTLRSEVINDVEDLQNTHVSFVVGSPKFNYSGKLAGLVKFQKLLDPNEESQSRSYARARYQDSYIEEVVIEAVPSQSSFENQLTGEEVEDYYFYALPNVTLEKGARAHFELFSTVVSYTDVYECTLVNQIDYNNLYRGPSGPGVSNKVYHGIKIQNKSSNPFAQAPVFILSGEGREETPLSQGLMKFTPKNGSSLVTISEAPEIEIKNNEIIEEKSDEGFDFWGRRYFRAQVKGTIHVTSYKNEAVDLELRSKIQGNLLDTSSPWKVLWQKTHSSPNDINFVQWDIHLKKGEEKEITYTFEVYVDR